MPRFVISLFDRLNSLLILLFLCLVNYFYFFYAVSEGFYKVRSTDRDELAVLSVVINAKIGSEFFLGRNNFRTKVAFHRRVELGVLGIAVFLTTSL